MPSFLDQHPSKCFLRLRQSRKWLPEIFLTNSQLSRLMSGFIDLVDNSFRHVDVVFKLGVSVFRKYVVMKFAVFPHLRSHVGKELGELDVVPSSIV